MLSAASLLLLVLIGTAVWSSDDPGELDPIDFESRDGDRISLVPSSSASPHLENRDPVQLPEMTVRNFDEKRPEGSVDASPDPPSKPITGPPMSGTWRVRQWITRNTCGWAQSPPPFTISFTETDGEIRAVARFEDGDRRLLYSGRRSEPGHFGLTLTVSDSRGEASARVQGRWDDNGLVAVERVDWTLPGGLTCQEAFRWEGDRE